MNTSRHSVGASQGAAVDAKPGTASVTLRELLERLPQQQRLPLNVGLQIVLAAGEVLARGHDRGGATALHGSLEPARIDVDHLGVVRLTGFGEPYSTRRRLAYQAPELRRGDAPDVLADVYSLAAVLYEVLTGYSLLQAVTREPCIGTEPAPRPSKLNPQVPWHLDEVVMGALSHDPAERPHSVRSLLGELRRLAREQRLEASQSKLKAYVDENLPWLKIRASGRIATPPPRPSSARPTLSMPAPPLSDPGGTPAVAPIAEAAAEVVVEPAPKPILAKPTKPERPKSVPISGKYDHAAYDETDEKVHSRARTSPAPIWTRLRWLFLRDLELKLRGARWRSLKKKLDALPLQKGASALPESAKKLWARRSVKLAAVALVVVALLLLLKPSHQDLWVHSTPMGAMVVLDGRTVGVTPLKLKSLTLAPHTVALSSPGFKVRTVSVNLTHGADAPLDVSLERDVPAAPAVAAPAEAVAAPEAQAEDSQESARKRSTKSKSKSRNSRKR